jgi:hypothetical protein
MRSPRGGSTRSQPKIENGAALSETDTSQTQRDPKFADTLTGVLERKRK